MVIKKILSIIFISFFLSNYVNADCYEDLDVEHKWFDVEYPYQEFTFKNKSKNTIEIVKTGIYAKDSKDIVIQWDKSPTIVFGYRQLTFSQHYLGNLNPDVLGERFYVCEYNYDYK